MSKNKAQLQREIADLRARHKECKAELALMDTREKEHTPGPWTIKGDNERAVHGADGGIVAIVIRTATKLIRPEEQARANARIIAAAPDLLAALRDARECIMELKAELNEETPCPAYIDDAIAKATPPTA